MMADNPIAKSYDSVVCRPPSVVAFLPPPVLHIHLLGHLRLFETERALKFAALPKTLSLFAYLLLHRAEALPRESLAYTLWPDVPEAEARANLRRHLHDLRRALPP